MVDDPKSDDTLPTRSQRNALRTIIAAGGRASIGQRCAVSWRTADGLAQRDWIDIVCVCSLSTSSTWEAVITDAGRAVADGKSADRAGSTKGDDDATGR